LKKIFLVKKNIFHQKNNFPEIYFLVVKYKVFAKKKPYQAQKTPIRQHDLREIPFSKHFVAVFFENISLHFFLGGHLG
jgi:hypothetical protein